MAIVFAREQFMWPIVGCCGMVRRDRIYPVGVCADEMKFKQKALEMVHSFENNDDENETYSLEYYEGSFGEEVRGDGKSLLKLELSGLDWVYSVNGIVEFKARDYLELCRAWL